MRRVLSLEGEDHEEDESIVLQPRGMKKEAPYLEHFRAVYADFIALKKERGESTASLTFERFSRKLEKNRAQYLARHQCDEVAFSAHVNAKGKVTVKGRPA